MNSKIISAVLLTFASLSGYAQENSADTVIVPLAESSKIIFTVGDPGDLEILRNYNFQKLFDDILLKLEESHDLRSDSAALANRREENRSLSRREISGDREEREEDWSNDDGDQAYNHEDDDDDSKWARSRRGGIGQTWQSYNIDLGTNNYLADDQFPDASQPYAVRPWGSWYVAGNSVQRTRLGRNFFMEWAVGVSWYNFKFQEDNILVLTDDQGVRFEADTRQADYVKSKLSATFINASLVPVIDFGDHSRKRRVWDGHGGGFRLGVGPYVGYRIASKSKLVYETDGDRERDKERDSFYLNNLRYGFRVQIGVGSSDFFINYDMNELFAENKGPKLNAISFGLIF